MWIRDNGINDCILCLDMHIRQGYYMYLLDLSTVPKA
jgi:hypothetical protein